MPRSPLQSRLLEQRRKSLFAVLENAAKPLSASQIAKLLAPKDPSMLHWCRKALPDLAQQGIVEQIQRPDILQPHYLYKLKTSTVPEASKVMEQSEPTPPPAPEVPQSAMENLQFLKPQPPESNKPKQLTIPQPQIPAPVRRSPAPTIAGAQTKEANKPMELHALIRNVAGVLELSGFQLKEFSSNENSISITATK